MCVDPLPCPIHFCWPIVTAAYLACAQLFISSIYFILIYLQFVCCYTASSLVIHLRSYFLSGYVDPVFHINPQWTEIFPKFVGAMCLSKFHPHTKLNVASSFTRLWVAQLIEQCIIILTVIFAPSFIRSYVAYTLCLPHTNSVCVYSMYVVLCLQMVSFWWSCFRWRGPAACVLAWITNTTFHTNVHSLSKYARSL